MSLSEDIAQEVLKFLDEKVEELDNEEYQEIMEEISSDLRTRLTAIQEEALLDLEEDEEEE
jgi:signal transduction histidine kinase